jgi:hypothetical protein
VSFVPGYGIDLLQGLADLSYAPEKFFGDRVFRGGSDDWKSGVVIHAVVSL